MRCTTCLVSDPECGFSKRQMRLATPRCVECIQLVHADVSDSTEAGKLRRMELKARQFRHEQSGFQDNGVMFKRQKGRAKVAAPKLTKAAKQAGHDAVAAFQARFRPEGRTPALAALVDSELGRLGTIVAGGGDDVADARKKMITLKQAAARTAKIEIIYTHPDPWWSDDEQLTDIISTLRGDEKRVELPDRPRNSDTDESMWKPGEFTGSPFMNNGCKVRFTCTDSAAVHVSTMPKQRLLSKPKGVMLMKKSGEVVGALAPTSLPLAVQKRLFAQYDWLFNNSPFLMRGADTASISCEGGFRVLGFKRDRNSGQALIHAGSRKKKYKDRVEFDDRFAHIFKEIKSIYHTQIHPIVVAAFGPLFLPVVDWFKEMEIEIFVDQVTASTGGDGFVPKSHKDADLWYPTMYPHPHPHPLPITLHPLPITLYPAPSTLPPSPSP